MKYTSACETKSLWHFPPNAWETEQFLECSKQGAFYKFLNPKHILMHGYKWERM